MKVSIITTIYKAEKDLPRLLDSMMAQKSQELEFFLIDNGSPDKCGDICREYAKKDSRFTVFTIKDNVGYIRARNIGMKECSGDYIGFCDSDDYLEVGGYDRAIEKIKETQCDFYIGSYSVVCDSKMFDYKQPYSTGRYLNEEISEKILPQLFGSTKSSNSLMAFAWKHIIKRTIVLSNSIDFIEDLKPYEDQIFNIDVAIKSKCIYIDDNKIYNYVQNQESITAQLKHKFCPEEEWIRINKLFEEKQKRVLTMEMQKSLYTGFLRWIKSLITNMSLNCSETSIKLSKRFKTMSNSSLLRRVAFNTRLNDNIDINFINICLRLKQYWLLFLCVRLILLFRGVRK